MDKLQFDFKPLKIVVWEIVILLQVNNHRSEVARLTSALESESCERRTLESEFGRVAEASRKAEDEKLLFLSSSLAKLVAFIPNAPSVAELLERQREGGGGGGGETGN